MYVQIYLTLYINYLFNKVFSIQSALLRLPIYNVVSNEIKLKFSVFFSSKYGIDLKLIFQTYDMVGVLEIIKLYSVNGQKISKKCKIQNFDFP